ncbi:TPA: helix-turn-helix domain-containing protein [Streptococcus suis]
MLNIDEIRKKENVSIVDIADCLGVRSQTVSDKISGLYDFKLGEAKKIRDTFFPQYDLLFLFSEKDKAEIA